ncbi:hypothetical protein L6R52_14240 [Myxococcota bacterium]|nr:hypothetical protein [Myxococcota bacterium]
MNDLATDLALLGRVPFLFGHHSVGDNLLEGLRGLASDAGVRLAITEQRPGKNGDPKAKIDDFTARVLAEPKDGAKLVVMKLCYADFEPQTNVDELFAHYVGSMERITRERPDLALMHVTSPICVFHQDAKARIKRVLGRAVWQDGEALRRVEYNERMRAKFGGPSLFDLARVESTRPTGQSEQAMIQGRLVEVLVPAFTDDGGHLNGTGRQAGARAFAAALAKCAAARGL